MVKVEVTLPGRTYPVVIGQGVLESLPEHVRGHSSAAVVADRAVSGLARRVADGLEAPLLEVEAGEELKSMAGLSLLLEFLAESGLDRAGCVVAVGGGSVGDAAGFAAAVWMRGVDLYQVPTTLLAMVDSSIGGKTGINTARGKNLVGAFWQPRAVMADLEAIATLPAGELQAAFGEVVKYGLAMDRELLQELTATASVLLDRDLAALESVIARCAALKAQVVAGDELDLDGRRAVLNYGHTAGHALESVSGYRIEHGRAVAHGLRIAARLGQAAGVSPPELVQAHDAALACFGLPGPLPTGLALEPVLQALFRDKKAVAGRLSWVLPVELGLAQAGHALPAGMVRDVIGGYLEEAA